MFIGRKEELSVLEKRYSFNRFEFGLIYGPLRIGKTPLGAEKTSPEDRKKKGYLLSGR